MGAETGKGAMNRRGWIAGTLAAIVAGPKAVGALLEKAKPVTDYNQWPVSIYDGMFGVGDYVAFIAYDGTSQTVARITGRGPDGVTVDFGNGRTLNDL